MGIEPSAWGPYVWGAIHTICLGAPEKLTNNQLQAYRTFMQSLPYVLPCEKCQTHLLENLERFPMGDDIDTREKLFAWSVGLHNRVNLQTGKAEMPLAEALSHWRGVIEGRVTPAPCKRERKPDTSTGQVWRWLVVVLLLSLILLLVGAGTWRIYHKK